MNINSDFAICLRDFIDVQSVIYFEKSLKTNVSIDVAFCFVIIRYQKISPNTFIYE